MLPSASVPLPSSSMWKRRFSSSTTSPLSALATMASTSGPTQSGAKVTLLPSCFSSTGTTGLSEYLGLTLPSGRPRCDMRITALAPLSMADLMVGMAPTMRCGLVTSLLASRGTLKSTCGVSVGGGHRGRCSGNKSQGAYADQDALPLEVDVRDGQLVGERHDGDPSNQLVTKDWS